MSEREAAIPNVSPESVQHRAETIFESRQIALKWLESPVRALGGAVPSELLRTPEGCSRVYQLLSKIEAGEFS